MALDVRLEILDHRPIRLDAPNGPVLFLTCYEQRERSSEDHETETVRGTGPGTGDGIEASFTSASSAVECAIAIQRTLARHTADSGDRDRSVRRIVITRSGDRDR